MKTAVKRTRLTKDQLAFVNEEQKRVFTEVREYWRGLTAKDRNLGGGQLETTLKRVAILRDIYLLTRGERGREKFNEMLRVTGVGDHPEFIRFFNWVAKNYLKHLKGVVL